MLFARVPIPPLNVASYLASRIHNYTEVLALLVQEGPTKIPLANGTAHGNLKPFGTKVKVNTSTNFVLSRLKN